jgi:two-component system, LytTR family, sensor histidine kinase AlgZ
VSARPEHFIIPELCNTTAIALLVLFSQLLVVILLFAGGELSWVRFGLMSLFVQWVALGSAGLLCLLRNVVAKLSLPLGSTLAFAVVMVVTVAVSAVSESIVDRAGDPVLRVLGYLTITGIITGLVFRYFYVQQRLRLQEQAELQSRIQALQSRIRPHFLFNSMNIIASLIASDPDTAETVVEDLSELFRASLNDAGSQVPLDEELDLCERYLRIEGLRLGERLNLQWDVAASTPGTRIPLLTLQPLLENAIYHGIQPLPDGGTIELSLHYDGDYVVVRIVNPVPPASVAQASQGNRMALQNIRSRLAVLYGNKATLETHDDGERFVTELRFPKMAQSV